MGHTEYLEPKVKEHAVRRAAGLEMQRVENGKPGCQPDCERRKNNVERDGEGKLNSGQKKSCGVHRKTSCPVPEIRPCYVDKLIVATAFTAVTMSSVKRLTISAPTP
jgi:hypothetical protein